MFIVGRLRKHNRREVVLMKKVLFNGIVVNPVLQLLALVGLIFFAFSGQADEDTSEGLLAVAPLFTPLLSLPAVIACYWLRRKGKPLLSGFMLFSGCLSCVAICVILGVSWFTGRNNIRLEDSVWLLPYQLIFTLLIGQGLWPLCLFALNLNRNDESDAVVSLAALAYGLIWIGICAGALVINLVPMLSPTITAILFPLFLLLILVEVLWLPLLSAWLYGQRPGQRTAAA